MKCWTIILFALFSTAAIGQTTSPEIFISCRFESNTLAECLDIIAENSELEFSYNSRLLPENQVFTYQFNAVSLNTVLSILLRETSLSYSLLDGFVIIKERKEGEPPIPPAKFSISGIVEDAKTGERLIGASVYSLDQSRGSHTNENGYFSFFVEADSLLLYTSFVGYETSKRPIGIYENTEVLIRLQPDGLLDSIVIVGTRLGEEVITVDQNFGATTITNELIDKMPGMLGEPDPMHTLGWLPGVQSGTADLGNLLVRNNENGHNLILLDGAQIYNPNHLLGLYSVFNSSAIKDVQLLKGAIPAKYGERLASVVEVNSKEGDFYNFQAEGSLSLIAAKAMVQGPIKKGKMSYLVSGRRTYIDLWTSAVLRSLDSEVGGGYFFDDFNVRLTHKVTERDDWSLTFYRGEDRFFANQERTDQSVNNPNLPPNTDNTTRNDQQVSWNNIAASFKWNHRWRYGTHSSFSAAYSRYRFLVRFESKQDGTLNGSPINRDFQLLYFSGVQDVSLRADFETNLSDQLDIKYGGSAIWHLYQPQASGTGFLTLNEDVLNTDIEGQDGEVEFAPLSLNAQESGLYIDATYNIDNGWQIQSGLHFASFGNRGVFYASVQPRLRLRYTWNSTTWVHFTSRINQQYAHLLNNTQYNLPTDLWVPSNDKVNPQLGFQVGIGLEKRWKKQYVLQLDGYYQYIDQLSTLNPTESFQKGKTWEDKILQGIGFNYGVELGVQKTQGQLTGVMSYHYSWAWRRFPLLNGGKNFPFRYNRRHNFSILLQYQISPKVRLSSGWNIASGNYISILNRQIAFGYPGIGGVTTGTYDSDASVNNFQVPTYHRLDVNIDFIKRKENYTRKWSLGVFNAYNRKNPTFYTNNFNGANRTLSGLTVFVLIPSIKYQLKF